MKHSWIRWVRNCLSGTGLSIWLLPLFLLLTERLRQVEGLAVGERYLQITAGITGVLIALTLLIMFKQGRKTPSEEGRSAFRNAAPLLIVGLCFLPALVQGVLSLADDMLMKAFTAQTSYWLLIVGNGALPLLGLYLLDKMDRGLIRNLLQGLISWLVVAVGTGLSLIILMSLRFSLDGPIDLFRRIYGLIFVRQSGPCTGYSLLFLAAVVVLAVLLVRGDDRQEIIRGGLREGFALLSVYGLLACLWATADFTYYVPGMLSGSYPDGMAAVVVQNLGLSVVSSSVGAYICMRASATLRTKLKNDAMGGQQA